MQTLILRLRALRVYNPQREHDGRDKESFGHDVMRLMKELNTRSGARDLGDRSKARGRYFSAERLGRVVNCTPPHHCQALRVIVRESVGGFAGNRDSHRSRQYKLR